MRVSISSLILIPKSSHKFQSWKSTDKDRPEQYHLYPLRSLARCSTLENHPRVLARRAAHGMVKAGLEAGG